MNNTIDYVGFGKVLASNLMLWGASKFHVYNSSYYALDGMTVKISSSDIGIHVTVRGGRYKRYITSDRKSFPDGWFYTIGNEEVMTEHVFDDPTIILGMLEYIFRRGEWSPKGVKQRVKELYSRRDELLTCCIECDHTHACGGCRIELEDDELIEMIPELEAIVIADEMRGDK